LGEVNDVRFHPNGRFFFTAGIDKKIKMWEWGTDSCVKRFFNCHSSIQSLSPLKTGLSLRVPIRELPESTYTQKVGTFWVPAMTTLFASGHWRINARGWAKTSAFWLFSSNFVSHHSAVCLHRPFGQGDICKIYASRSKGRLWFQRSNH
jgi:hypothetical protein